MFLNHIFNFPVLIPSTNALMYCNLTETDWGWKTCKFWSGLPQTSHQDVSQQTRVSRDIFISGPNIILAATPLEASRGPWGRGWKIWFWPLPNFCSLKRKEKFFFWGGGFIFQGAISLGRVVVPCPKIFINLPRTYVKLPCKGEPYRFSF